MDADTGQPEPDAFDDFACDQIFDADYLAFYLREVPDAISDEEAELVGLLLNLESGDRVLDLPCGYGRIARRLAAAGAEVVAVDSSELFLEHARADAARHDVAVDYRAGDMRTIEFDSEFDALLCWFTSFGYSDDATLQQILRRMWRALAPGGRLLLETMNLHDPELTASSSTTCKELVEDGASRLMVDRSRYDSHDGRLYVRRLITHGDRPAREMRYFLRLFSLPELAGWLRAAGFINVQAYGGDGEVFRADSGRLILAANRP